MINREQFINEIAEVVNRNSMEKAFNDTPDFILARIAVEAMEMFTRASAHRDDYHGFRTADYDRKYKAICESEKKAKPVVIEAVEYTGYNIVEVQQFVGKKLDGDFYDAPNHNATMSITIPTLEGDMKAIPGDYIIKGVKGEFYPCKPDIFKQTYDPAE